MKDIRIVTIGGGTGMSTLLRGLKAYTENITAIVNMVDDGGGSGLLRADLGVLPPGDVRNCLVALADKEPQMEALFRYRFPSGILQNQSLGNLIIAAMEDMCGSFEKAISIISHVLAISGKVLPVTTESVHLCARFSDGDTVQGESSIPMAKLGTGCRIEEVRLVPEKVQAAPGVLESILEADAILLGPGSLYTSVIPNLLVEGVREALSESRAPKIYICNVMTQPGETDGYTAFDHVEAILRHGGKVEYCLVNAAPLSEEVRLRYTEKGADAVKIDSERFSEKGIGLIRGALLREGVPLARHNPGLLSEKIMEFLSETVDTRRYAPKKTIQEGKKEGTTC